MAKPSKKEQDAELARRAFRDSFDRDKVPGHTPKIDFTNLHSETPKPVPQAKPVLEAEPVPEAKPVSKPEPIVDEPRKTGLYLLLPIDGWVHPDHGNFLMLPKQFKAILALETKAVAQVCLEVLEHTIGWEEADGSRREWVKLASLDFQMGSAMSYSQVQQGIKVALEKGYILRRKVDKSYEYALPFKDVS